MIPALVKQLGSTFNKTAGTTLALTTTGSVAAGNLIVARVLFDNAATASKPAMGATNPITRAAGETNNWVFLGAARSTSTSAGSFASGEMWCIQTTVAWPAAAYTVTLDTSVTQKAMAFTEYSGAQAVMRSTSGTNYSTTTVAATAQTTGTAPQVNDLGLGFIFGSNVAVAQSGDLSSGPNGSWSAPVGFGSTGSGAATNNFGIGQYEVLAGTLHEFLENSAAMTAGNGAIVAILQSIPEPSITQAAYRFYADDIGASSVSNSYDFSNYNVSVGLLSQVGQSFLGDDKILSRAAFYLRHPGTSTGSISIDLYAHTGTFGSTGTGTGPVLITSTTVLDIATLTTSWTKYYFDFAPTFTLNSGTPYVVVLRAAVVGEGAPPEAAADSSSPTHAGTYQEYNGSTWAAYSSYDLVFETYTVVPGESSSTPLAPQDTALTVDVSSGDVNLQLRTRLQVTANEGQPTDDYQLQYEKNSGGWSTLSLAGPYSTENTGTNYLNTSITARGQSFLSAGESINRVDFMMSRGADSGGTLEARLYAHAGTFGSSSVATGGALATSTARNVSDIPYPGESWVSFDFNTPYAGTAGTHYVIAVHRISSTGSDVLTCRSLGTHPGNVTEFTGGNWGAASGIDLTFRTFLKGQGVESCNSANLTDAAATTNRLTGGTGSFVAGKVSEDGLVDDLVITASNYTELLYSITLKQSLLTNGDTLQFRVLRNGATTGLTYTAVPTINVTVGGGAATLVAPNQHVIGTPMTGMQTYLR